MLYAFRRSANISLFLVLSVFMFEHQKDTVNCVASGKEQCITVKDVYEMSQTKNKQYRWKHAFQFPSVFRTLPYRSHYLKINSDEKGEFDARIRVDCAETSVKLKIYAKKYIAAFEEDSMGKIDSETLEKKKLHKQSISHSMENILLDVFATTACNQRCNRPR